MVRRRTRPKMSSFQEREGCVLETPGLWRSQNPFIFERTVSHPETLSGCSCTRPLRDLSHHYLHRPKPVTRTPPSTTSAPLSASCTDCEGGRKRTGVDGSLFYSVVLIVVVEGPRGHIGTTGVGRRVSFTRAALWSNVVFLS